MITSRLISSFIESGRDESAPTFLEQNGGDSYVRGMGESERFTTDLYAYSSISSLIIPSSGGSVKLLVFFSVNTLSFLPNDLDNRCDSFIASKLFFCSN